MMLSSYSTLTLLAYFGQLAIAQKFHGIAIRNREMFEKSDEHTQSYELEFLPEQPRPSFKKMLSDCAAFAAKHQGNRFSLTFDGGIDVGPVAQEVPGGAGGSLGCFVYNSADGAARELVEWHVMIGQCSRDADCTSSKDFGVQNTLRYGAHFQYSVNDLDLEQCLQRVARINESRPPQSRFRNVQWMMGAHTGDTTCAIPRDVIPQIRQQLHYVGTIATDDAVYNYRNLSCSSPFIQQGEVDDCESFVWDKPQDAKDSLRAKYSRWRFQPKIDKPERLEAYRPPLPTNPSESLEYNLLDINYKTRLDTDAFKNNVRIISGSGLIYHKIIKALNSTAAIRQCAAQAQQKFYRTFSLVQRHGHWQCNLIWEELLSTKGLMIKDNDALWSFVYSASLNSTQH